MECTDTHQPNPKAVSVQFLLMITIIIMYVCMYGVCMYVSFSVFNQYVLFWIIYVSFLCGDSGKDRETQRTERALPSCLCVCVDFSVRGPNIVFCIQMMIYLLILIDIDIDNGICVRSSSYRVLVLLCRSTLNSNNSTA